MIISQLEPEGRFVGVTVADLDSMSKKQYIFVVVLDLPVAFPHQYALVAQETTLHVSTSLLWERVSLVSNVHTLSYYSSYCLYV